MHLRRFLPLSSLYLLYSGVQWKEIVSGWFHDLILKYYVTDLKKYYVNTALRIRNTSLLFLCKHLNFLNTVFCGFWITHSFVFFICYSSFCGTLRFTDMTSGTLLKFICESFPLHYVGNTLTDCHWKQLTQETLEEGFKEFAAISSDVYPGSYFSSNAFVIPNDGS